MLYYFDWEINFEILDILYEVINLNYFVYVMFKCFSDYGFWVIFFYLILSVFYS